MKTIGWWVGTDTDWAFMHLSRHLQRALPEFGHRVNAGGDINVSLSPVFLGRDVAADGRCLLHLDGNRFYEEAGVDFCVDEKRVLHLVWALDVWSWGLVFRALSDRLAGAYRFVPMEFGAIRAARSVVGCAATDLFFCQNVTQLSGVPAGMLGQTICRLGGNMNFSESGRVNRWMRQMGQCAAVVATNRKLYHIGKLANENTYLIPNGLDTDIWRPDPCRVWRRDRPVVGFVGNISTPQKAAYKGFDLVRRACAELDLPFKTALYKDAQIPHERMKADFWDRIDLFVLPTNGEGCSNSIMEALACGVPVITTRRAGYHGEMLTDGHDVVFTEKTVDSVKAAIGFFLDHPVMFELFAVNGRCFAIENHDIEKVATQFREVFDRHFAPMDPAGQRGLYCAACDASHNGAPPCAGCAYNAEAAEVLDGGSR